jgi:hypothetical protein
VLGVAGLEHLPFPSFAAPLLLGLVLLNVLAVWWRGHARRQYGPFWCCLSGALLLAPLAFGQQWPWLSVPGVALSLLGVLASVGRARTRALVQLP